MTFVILSSSFYDKEDETAADLVEITRRQIIENGGRVLDDDQKSNYVIAEDGYRQDVWTVLSSGKGDEKQRLIVHRRWVEACIKENQIFDHENAYHLCPLPQKTPISVFKNVTIAFCLFTSELDKVIFETLANLAGFKNKFKE